MPPRFLPPLLEKGFDGLFGSLLSGEACPLIKATPQVALGMFQIALGLIHPIGASLHRVPFLCKPYSPLTSKPGRTSEPAVSPKPCFPSNSSTRPRREDLYPYDASPLQVGEAPTPSPWIAFSSTKPMGALRTLRQGRIRPASFPSEALDSLDRYVSGESYPVPPPCQPHPFQAPSGDENRWGKPPLSPPPRGRRTLMEEHPEPSHSFAAVGLLPSATGERWPPPSRPPASWAPFPFRPRRFDKQSRL